VSYEYFKIVNELYILNFYSSIRKDRLHKLSDVFQLINSVRTYLDKFIFVKLNYYYKITTK